MSVADRTAGEKAKQGGIGETIKVVVQALLIALVFRTFLYHPFNIPSGSMEPTLLVGDYLFVSKFSYGYSRYSFPIDLPFIDGRVWDGAPDRGDIAVFRPPREPETDYIKRVVGLPGDRIQMQDGALYINGEAVTREDAGEWEGEGRFGDSVGIKQYRETLPNGVNYLTLDMTESGAGDDTRIYDVPPGHYFLMGDNRDNSQDSRFLDGPVGFVPAENLVGRADMLFFSVEGGPAWAFWRWPTALRLDRIFDTL
ncbi:MAG: signal peptidase I [Pseudomonadota bacterium]|nr:signal peptidase I [Pseudomonadota bacterium]